MADTKLHDLAELTAPAADDELEIVDRSDSSMDADGTNKRIKYQAIGPIIVRKTADETVNNSNTLQNDDHLVLSVLANEVFAFDMTLLTLGASANPDWKLGWTVPASTTMRWGAYGTVGAQVPWGAAGAGGAQNAARTEAETSVLGGGAVAGVIPVRGIIIVAGTAGNVQFQWAQNTQTAEDSKILTNSVLIATKIG